MTGLMLVNLVAGVFNFWVAILVWKMAYPWAWDGWAKGLFALNLFSCGFNLFLFGRALLLSHACAV